MQFSRLQSCSRDDSRLIVSVLVFGRKVLIMVLVLHPSSLGFGLMEVMEVPSTAWTAAEQTPDNLLRRWPERRCSHLTIGVANIRRRGLLRQSVQWRRPLRLWTTWYLLPRRPLGKMHGFWHGVRNVTKEFVHCWIRCSASSFNCTGGTFI